MDSFDRVKYSTFFDLNENSMMDILVVRNGADSASSITGGGSFSNITAIYNNYGKDAFFLKTRMVSDSTIGTSVSSASFRAVLTSLEDEKFMVSGGQSGQSGY